MIIQKTAEGIERVLLSQIAKRFPQAGIGKGYVSNATLANLGFHRAIPAEKPAVADGEIAVLSNEVVEESPGNFRQQWSVRAETGEDRENALAEIEAAKFASARPGYSPVKQFFTGEVDVEAGLEAVVDLPGDLHDIALNNVTADCVVVTLHILQQRENSSPEPLRFPESVNFEDGSPEAKTYVAVKLVTIDGGATWHGRAL